MKHIAVIGAGVTGVTTAYALLERGFSVSVFDRERYAAMQTSFANGGQLSASNAEVWNQFATVIKGIKWMMRKDAPLLVNPTPSWHKISWMAEFVANIGNYAKNTIETTRLAVAAREHLFAWAAAENIDFDLEQRGILHIYQDRKDHEHAARVNRLLAAGGLERRAVSPDEMRAIEPTLTGRYYGGFFTESDATGDIHKFTQGLAKACRRRGAVFRHETEVSALRHSGSGVHVTSARAGSTEAGQTEHFDGVVLCAGVHSRRLASQLGDRVNIYPVKGYSVTVNLPDEASRQAAPWVSLLDDSAKVVTSRLGDGRLRIAGTAEFNGYSRDIRNDRIEPLVRWCRHHFPGVDTEHVVPWAGLRPMMPDMLPRVGSGRRSGVFYNTGHGHLGWTLSPVTAQMVAQVVATQMGGQAVGPVRQGVAGVASAVAGSAGRPVVQAGLATTS